MLQPQSQLKAIDNSGARRMRCIRILKKSGRQCGKVGNFIKVSIQRLRNRGNIRVRCGEVHTAVIVRTANRISRSNGVKVKFDSNAAIVLNHKNVPFGTRFFSVIAKELRFRKFVKVFTLSPRVV